VIFNQQNNKTMPENSGKVAQNFKKSPTLQKKPKTSKKAQNTFKKSKTPKNGPKNNTLNQ
jgi:hypothetical protein